MVDKRVVSWESETAVWWAAERVGGWVTWWVVKWVGDEVDEKVEKRVYGKVDEKEKIEAV